VGLGHVLPLMLLPFRYLSYQFSPFPLSKCDIFHGEITAVFFSFLLPWFKTCNNHVNNNFQVVLRTLEFLQLIFS